MAHGEGRGGHVDRRLDGEVLELRGQAHIDPHRALLLHHLLGLRGGYPLQQRLVHQLTEIILAQAHQHAIGEHGVAEGAGRGDNRRLQGKRFVSTLNIDAFVAGLIFLKHLCTACAAAEAFGAAAFHFHQFCI